MENYRKSSHCTYDIKYHLVWITKYRKPVITGQIALRTRELIRIVCQSNEVEILAGHVGSDHIHLLVHKVFNSPVDKLIWDVSHQSYPHKVLTGRKEFFTDNDKFSGTTGYTDPEENEHDFIRVGHTSTSIATAMGYALARDMQGKNGIL